MKRGSATALAESPRNPDIVWVGTDDDDLGTSIGEDLRGDGTCCTVGTVEHDL